jgi:hypothetical protein
LYNTYIIKEVNDKKCVIYFKSFLHIFIQLFHRSRIPKQPLLYLNEFIKYNKNDELIYEEIYKTSDTYGEFQILDQHPGIEFEVVID